MLLRESRDSGHGRRFDVAGAVTITAALVALVYAVVEAPQQGWADGQTLGLLALSAVLIALFVAIEARSAAPLAPLRVFRSRALVGGNLVLFALGMLAFGMPFILTQYAQGVLALLGARVRARLGRHAGDGGDRVDHRAGDRDQGRPAPGRRGRLGPDGPRLPAR